MAIRGVAPITPVPSKARNRAFFCVDIAYRRSSFSLKEAKSVFFIVLGAPWAQHTPLSQWKSGCRISMRDTLALLVDCCLLVDILKLLIISEIKIICYTIDNNLIDNNKIIIIKE